MVYFYCIFSLQNGKKTKQIGVSGTGMGIRNSRCADRRRALDRTETTLHNTPMNRCLPDAFISLKLMCNAV